MFGSCCRKQTPSRKTWGTGRAAQRGTAGTMAGDAGDQFGTMAARPEATGDYQILRRLSPRPAIALQPGVARRQGLFVDVETTGLDPDKDEVIELSMAPFTYTLEGEVLAVEAPFQAFREPDVPILPEITRLTGITSEMVAGQQIDLDAVSALVAPAALVLAHNAAFDRRFLERLNSAFVASPGAAR